MNKVQVWKEKVSIPTYEAGKPDKNPMFLEKRVYQGSSGRIYPHTVIEKISDEKVVVAGRRTNEHRFGQTFLNPTLKATPGDLSLVIPKRQLDDIIEMIYALDKIAPGMANIDTLLYGVEVKFYNSRVDVDENLETAVKGLYVLGDGSGVTHSLSQASASGVFAARTISEKFN